MLVIFHYSILPCTEQTLKSDVVGVELGVIGVGNTIALETEEELSIT